jgi:hypothetical protein
MEQWLARTMRRNVFLEIWAPFSVLQGSLLLTYHISPTCNEGFGGLQNGSSTGKMVKRASFDARKISKLHSD